MSIIDEVDAKFKEYNNLSEQEGTLEARKGLMADLKIALTQFETLPPSTHQPDPKECIIARGIYEFAVFQSIEEGDIEGFKHILPESSKKNSVIGLYLLYLLSQNLISEFHVELQSIPSADHNNIYINVPVSLEQYFVDGNYAKVLATKHAPLDVYNFFIKKFIDTVRTEIARSVEVSYKKLSIKDACEVFMLDDIDQLKEFVERESDINNSDRTISWVIKDDYLHFDTITIEKEGIPAKKMIYQVLDYAREL